jgi:hypothetical protein
VIGVNDMSLGDKAAMVYSPDNAKHPPKNNSLSPNTQHLPPKIAFIVTIYLLKFGFFA